MSFVQLLRDTSILPAQVPVLQDFNGNSSFDISKAAWALKNLAVENPFCVAKYLYCYAAHISRFYSLAITQWLKCLKFCGILCKFLLAFCRESTEGSKKKKIFSKAFAIKGQVALEHFACLSPWIFRTKRGLRKYGLCLRTIIVCNKQSSLFFGKSEVFRIE